MDTARLMPAHRLSPSLHPYTQQLNTLACRVHAASPDKPHRPFVVNLIREVRQVTGQFHSANWYMGLIAGAGIARRPSTRTFALALTTAKDAAGEAVGPTLASVQELRRQISGMTRTMAEMKAMVARQEMISGSLEKRQLMFADQAKTYQRQIDALTATVSVALAKVSKEVDRMSKAASDITLDSHRLGSVMPRAAPAISEAVRRLAAAPRG